MTHDPILTTDRLTLRPFRAGDAPAMQEMVSRFEVARMTGSIPHPCPDGYSAEWIASLPEKRRAGTDIMFAVEVQGALAGAVGLLKRGCTPATIEEPVMEASCWIGVPYWSTGIATEATRAVLDYGFEALHLERINANFFDNNQGSLHVLAKLGFSEIGRRVSDTVDRSGSRVLILTALTRDVWEKQTRAGQNAKKAYK